MNRKNPTTPLPSVDSILQRITVSANYSSKQKKTTEFTYGYRAFLRVIREKIKKNAEITAEDIKLSCDTRIVEVRANTEPTKWQKGTFRAANEILHHLRWHQHFSY